MDNAQDWFWWSQDLKAHELQTMVWELQDLFGAANLPEGADRASLQARLEAGESVDDVLTSFGVDMSDDA